MSSWTFYFFRQNDYPIEDWIGLAESVKMVDTKMTSGEQATSGDWSHAVQDTLSVIISEEKHPDPGKFNLQILHFTSTRTVLSNSIIYYAKTYINFFRGLRWCGL